MLARFLVVLAALFGFSLAAPAAPPRDEALRLVPGDFALVVVGQNWRDHVTAIGESPFAAWFPTSAPGKKLLDSAALKNLTDSSAPVFDTLGITPTQLLHDIIGDAVVFAYQPAPAADPKGERSLILVRPRKVETLSAVIDRLNDVQTKSKELEAVVGHKYKGAVYFERKKPEGQSEFYCFRDGVFAFSQARLEIQALIDRDAGAPKDKPPALVARMAKLGVADAAVAILVNPRPLDAELAAKVKNARPDEGPFLTRFAEVWAATESAALYFALGTGVELGLSVQFDPDKLPADARAWLVGERVPSALWAAVPDSAMLALAGRVKVTDLIAVLDSLNAADGKKGVREMVGQTLGPIVGKGKLPLVLDALGPDWGGWIAPPAKDAVVPVAVAAVRVRGDDPNGAEASKKLLQTLEYGFQWTQIAYNVKHKNQIELREEKDGDAVIKSLSGDDFPAGFRPCFALKGGYLLVSTSPDAIKAFRAPDTALKAGGDVPLARFSAAATRAYLSSSAPQLAKLLSAAGVGEEKVLVEQLGMLERVLEPVDRVELLVRGDATGVKLMLRTKMVKPLKK